MTSTTAISAPVRPRRAIAGPRIPLTLLAAVLATSLIGVAALLSRANTAVAPGSAGPGLAGQVALTATPSHTWTPTPQVVTPTQTPSITPAVTPTLPPYPTLDAEAFVAILWSDQLASMAGISAGISVDVLTARATGANERLAEGALVVEVNRRPRASSVASEYVALRVRLSEIEGINATFGTGETLTLAIRGDIARQRVVAVRADALIDREITRAFLDECALVDVVAVLRFVDVVAVEEFQSVATPSADRPVDGVEVGRMLRGAEVILAPDDANLGWALQVDRDEDQRVLAFLSEAQAPLLLVPACFE